MVCQLGFLTLWTTMKATSLQVIVLHLQSQFFRASLPHSVPYRSLPDSFPHTPAPSLTPPSLPLSLGGTTFNSSGIRILCLTLTKWWTLFHYFSHFYGEHNRSHKHLLGNSPATSTIGFYTISPKERAKMASIVNKVNCNATIIYFLKYNKS